MLSEIKPKNNNEINYSYFAKQVNKDLRYKPHWLRDLYRGKKRPKK